MAEFFPLVPVSTKVYFWVFGLIAVTGVLFAAMTVLGWGAFHSGFEVSTSGLALKSPLYGRTVPGSSILVEEARELDFRTEEDRKYLVRFRTNGIGLPGYLAGWMRLRNGEKSLVFMTDRGRVVYVPTREGYSILLSVEDPDAFLTKLREANGYAGVR